MFCGFPIPSGAARLLRAAVSAVALAVSVAAGRAEAPDSGRRPTPRPDPYAAWREEQGDEAAARRAFERQRQEDWHAWERERGETWDEWLQGRREAERALDAQRRRDWLERQRPRPEGQGREIGERLGEQWRRQRELWDDRGPGMPRRDPLRAVRP